MMVRSRLLWIPPLAAVAFLGVMLFLTSTGDDRPLPQPSADLDRLPPPPPPARAPAPPPMAAVRPAAPAPVPPPQVVPVAGPAPVRPPVADGDGDDLPDPDGLPHRPRIHRMHPGPRPSPVESEE